MLVRLEMLTPVMWVLGKNVLPSPLMTLPEPSSRSSVAGSAPRASSTASSWAANARESLHTSGSPTMGSPSALQTPFSAAWARQAFIWRIVMSGSTIMEAAQTHSVTQSSAGAHSGSTLTGGASTSPSAAPCLFSGAPTGSMPGRGFSPMPSGSGGGPPASSGVTQLMVDASSTTVACGSPPELAKAGAAHARVPTASRVAPAATTLRPSQEFSSLIPCLPFSLTYKQADNES